MNIETLATTTLAAPSITAVVDSAGNPVPNNGTTQDTELTLSGAGPANSVAIIYDNGSAIGTASVISAGTWEKSVTAELGAHSFTVSVVGEGVSVAWVVTVTTGLAAPVIISIKDSKGNDIPSGSTTSDTHVILNGTAAPDYQVEIYDGDVFVAAVPVDSSGNWAFEAPDLAVKTYAVKVKALYGSGEESAVWTLTVGEAPLSIAPGTMLLDGIAIKVSWPRTGREAVGNSAIRTASGGSLPYTYFSTNSAVASVSPQGLVVGNANGTAIIQVEDQKGASVNYNVVVSNVYQLFANELLLNYAEAVNWMNSLGGTPVGYDALAAMKVVYISPYTPSYYWLCTIGGCPDPNRMFYHPAYNDSSQAACSAQDGLRGAWCLRLK